MFNDTDAKYPYNTFLTTLQGDLPKKIPFITRLETWYRSHKRAGSLPKRFLGMNLLEVHQAIGVGQLKYLVPYAFKLRGVEVVCRLNNEVYVREFEPTIKNFPGMWDLVLFDKAGDTEITLHTSNGSLRVCHKMLEEGVITGIEPYLKEHMVKNEDDLKVVEYIIEHSEFAPNYEEIQDQQKQLGPYAFVVPLLHRIPFQQALLEYLGEINLFYFYYDEPSVLKQLLNLLDEQMMGILKELASFNWPYVEFTDNLDGMMTNPKLFREFCLPAYQKYTSILQSQGKKVGSHIDGNVKPLLELLTETGLDVCESFSPFPLTECTFKEAWDAWRAGPLIWGGIPSPILEVGTSEDEFDRFIEMIFQTIKDRPIVLGIVDLLFHHNSIERVEKIAKRIDQLTD